MPLMSNIKRHTAVVPSLAESIAQFVKSNEKVFKLLGVAFFLLTAAIGVLWIFGRDVESVAFVLGCISSSMFGVVEVAHYISPNRKAVRDMDIDEVLAFVQLSNVQTDWKLISTGIVSEAALKEDPRLRVTIRYDERGVHEEDFREPWANGFPDPSARSYWAEVTYDRAILDRYVLVSVDGGRAMLPMPNSRVDLHVGELKYRVAELFDGAATLQQYFARAGLRRDA
jgi:hypothetical protein